MNVILFGFKSCGKTTLGKMLATRMNRPFIDTDEMLEMIYFEQTGEQTPFRQIYKAIGEEKFRALESKVVILLQNTQHSIIALGGGLILNPKNAASLAKLGQLVYLKVSKETVKRRVLGKELPSFLDPKDPKTPLNTITMRGDPNMKRYPPYRLIWRLRHRIKSYWNSLH